MTDTTLAHYRITSRLGKGGMGEVWRATDESLDREVALKVLTEEFASDLERLAGPGSARRGPQPDPRRWCAVQGLA